MDRKDWDQHVSDLEQVARGEGFQALRDRIIELSRLRRTDRVVDVGSGTGLLALAAARHARHVWAVDISPAMTRRLAIEARRNGLTNVEPITASAHRLPLADASADALISNYCYHHLSDADKRTALTEARRVLRPGGRLVIGDMMFRVRVSDSRDRAIIGRAILNMLRRGPAGVLRIAKNAVRYLTGRWEQPADADWWRQALQRAGFRRVDVAPLDHEGGIATAVNPGVADGRPGRV